MKLFSQYRGLRRENYVLFFGNIVTNMGSMVWPMMTLILDKKMGLSAGNIALLLMFGSILCMPASLLGGRLDDRDDGGWAVAAACALADPGGSARLSQAVRERRRGAGGVKSLLHEAPVGEPENGRCVKRPYGQAKAASPGERAAWGCLKTPCHDFAKRRIFL